MIPPYVILQKEVGETPLVCAEKWRAEHPEYAGLPLSYAGRLDPMASGALLILIGEECKNQKAYHGLDKTYELEILFGIGSDSGDVLGLVKESIRPVVTVETLAPIVESLIGTIELPYPAYSSKTVQGIPLHTWAVTGKIAEVTIPTKTSEVYSITLNSIRTLTRTEVVEQAVTKIASLPTVTDPRKVLGNDFRRPQVLASWDAIKQAGNTADHFSIAHLTITASSGTYMRTLAEVIAKRAHSTSGLALSIHRTNIGTYDKKVPGWSRLLE